MKRIPSKILLTILLTSGAIVMAADPATTIWYDKPASDWEREALPIGNGRLGAMIFGGVERADATIQK